MIKVSVNGALGKMGSTVCNAVINNSETELIDSVDINSKNHKTPNGKLIHKDFSGIFFIKGQWEKNKRRRACQSKS